MIDPDRLTDKLVKEIRLFRNEIFQAYGEAGWAPEEMVKEIAQMGSEAFAEGVAALLGILSVLDIPGMDDVIHKLAKTEDLRLYDNDTGKHDY